MTRTIVVAEPGSTADGDFGRMLAIIDLAKAVGCDVVKWQWLSSARALAERRHAPEYESAYRKIAVPVDWLAMLCDATRDAGMDAWCSVYLPGDAEIVAPYVSTLKVSSFELMSESLRAAVIATGKPYVVSTGLADLNEAKRVASWPNVRAILHCVSSYPAPIEQLNLAAIPLLASVSNLIPVGFSDHSRHILTGALAVAAGSEVVEFHLMLSDTPESNADFCVSRDADEAMEYVSAIRLAEKMLGDGVKGIQAAEHAFARYRVVS